MRRPHATLPVVAVSLAASLALGGCGGKDAAVTTAPSIAGATSSPCPTDNTRNFAKTRLVVDLGLTAGTFHRYIYNPYKAGAFEQGAKGRTLALVKAGATAAADAKLLSNAAENIKANPTLCTALYGPMLQLQDKLSDLKGDILSGNLGGIDGVQTLVTGLESTGKADGLDITETVDTAGS